jgi:hypothetical protein
MKKNLLLLLVASLFNIALFAQTVTIGTANTIAYTIFNMQDPYTRQAAVYTAAELTQTGTITSIGWSLNHVWSNGDGPVKIYLKENVNASLSSDTWANIKNGATVVYDNSVDFPSSASNPTWVTINLSTPFAYTTGNLLVLVESNYGGTGNGATGGDIDINCTSGMSGKAEFWWGNPIQTSGTLSANRPVLQITFDSSTGIIANNDSSSKVLSIFPNPATQSFNYSANEIGNADLMIFDMQGNQVYSEMLDNQAKGSVDISFLPKGCYLVSIVNDKLNLHSRLLVQ